MSALDSLQESLDRIIPGARLVPTRPPDCPEVELLLLNGDYPQGELDAGAVARVMDNPLYWVFCWASGQVLARFLLHRPAYVAGRRVLDFGCGCGIVAIAAKLAGAREVIACDSDPQALAATALNADRNGVALSLCTDLDAVRQALDVILVADVLYDRTNLPWLDRFTQRADRVLVADSRVKDFSHPRYRRLAAFDSGTVPDLDESPEFRDVRLYLSERAAVWSVVD